MGRVTPNSAAIWGPPVNPLALFVELASYIWRAIRVWRGDGVVSHGHRLPRPVTEGSFVAGTWLLVERDGRPTTPQAV